MQNINAVIGQADVISVSHITRQGYGCENLISHLTEMISMVLYTLEYGDSESRMGLNVHDSKNQRKLAPLKL